MHFYVCIRSCGNLVGPSMGLLVCAGRGWCKSSIIALVHSGLLILRVSYWSGAFLTASGSLLGLSMAMWYGALVLAPNEIPF